MYEQEDAFLKKAIFVIIWLIGFPGFVLVRRRITVNRLSIQQVWLGICVVAKFAGMVLVFCLATLLCSLFVYVIAAFCYGKDRGKQAAISSAYFLWGLFVMMIYYAVVDRKKNFKHLPL